MDLHQICCRSRGSTSFVNPDECIATREVCRYAGWGRAEGFIHHDHCCGAMDSPSGLGIYMMDSRLGDRKLHIIPVLSKDETPRVVHALPIVGPHQRSDTMHATCYIESSLSAGLSWRLVWLPATIFAGDVVGNEIGHPTHCGVFEPASVKFLGTRGRCADARPHVHQFEAAPEH